MLAARADRKAGPDASSGLRQVATGRLSMPAKDEGREGVAPLEKGPLLWPPCGPCRVWIGRLLQPIESGGHVKQHGLDDLTPFYRKPDDNAQAVVRIRMSLDQLMAV